MQNTHLRSLLAQARAYVYEDGVIPYDHHVAMLQAGLGASLIESNLRKEFLYD